MPVTLPAHAAAVLPLLGLPARWRSPVALVVGAAAPDLIYIVGHAAHDSHSLPGLFTFCLPAGLALLLWAEWLVLPVLRRTLPTLGGLQPGRLLHTRGLPRSAAGWAVVVASLLLGAATHLLWDGFTHARAWPARALYGDVMVALGERTLPLARVLQHVSSLVGSALVLAYLARRYRRLPAGQEVGSWRAVAPLLSLTLAGGLGGLLWRLMDYRSLGALEAQLWWLFWPTAGGALAGLSLGCLLLHRVAARPAAASGERC